MFRFSRARQSATRLNLFQCLAIDSHDEDRTHLGLEKGHLTTGFVPWLCALHAHAGSASPESFCCTEAIIAFMPTPPKIAPFWASPEVLANYRNRH